MASFRSRLGRKLKGAATLARENPREFLSVVTGRVTRMKIYAAEPQAIPANAGAPPGDFRPLPEEELRRFDASVDFYKKQLDRLERFGGSHAFGVFVDGELAHVSWLIPAPCIRLETPLILLPRENEAEITACETLPEFRGRGIYPFVIRELARIARARGVRRIYMKTAAENTSSQAGILKAGLRPIGSAVLAVPPTRQSTWVIRLFR